MKAWLAWVMVAGTLIWGLVSLTHFYPATIRALGCVMPSWLATANLAVLPLAGALCAAPLTLPSYLRFGSWVVLVLSATTFAVSYRYHPIGSLVVLILTYLEAYWLIPRWKASWRRSHPSG